MKVYAISPPKSRMRSSRPRRSENPIRSLQGICRKGGPADKIDLSGKAKEMAEMLTVINQLPEIRLDKVQAVEKFC